MSRDRGIQLDIWDRNLKKTLGVPATNPGINKLVDALEAAVRIRPNRFLSQMICTVRKFCEFPTEKQLSFINDLLEQRGMHRVSCPVRFRGREGYKKNALYRMRQDEKSKSVAAVDEMLSMPMPKKAVNR